MYSPTYEVTETLRGVKTHHLTNHTTHSITHIIGLV